MNYVKKYVTTNPAWLQIQKLLCKSENDLDKLLAKFYSFEWQKDDLYSRHILQW